ncbi:class I SAM-dependent methyltransferase [Desulfovibrio sp. TomC]|uniref:class I SAM-dependent methyltransferase n=1 Tax=Desulfovibrio sp. TomC TaxID=1562888 RepID=UPI0005B89F29|nr:class I SAM-dependent methyltransferase [Desulfovibrio sp. TomC]
MYWTTASCVPSTLDLAPAVRAFLAPGDRIIDLGCGPGRTLNALRQAGLGRCHVGADVNPPSLLLAACAGFPVVQADLAAMPVADAAFDAGILQAVLTTIPTPGERLAVLREARRIVTRVLCLGDFLQNWELPYYRTRYETGLAETGECGSFVVREGAVELYQAHHFTMDELGDLLGRAGFSVVQAAYPTVRTRSGNLVRGVSLAALTL